VIGWQIANERIVRHQLVRISGGNHWRERSSSISLVDDRLQRRDGIGRFE
jgi:hypothetical protein